MNDNTLTDFDEGDPCPTHGTAHKKTYRFGSSMSMETEVCVFQGCPCAVSISHDPVGTYSSVSRLHGSYDEAHGTGKLNAAMAAVKYR